jgi:hypothetical protein
MSEIKIAAIGILTISLLRPPKATIGYEYISCLAAAGSSG